MWKWLWERHSPTNGRDRGIQNWYVCCSCPITLLGPLPGFLLAQALHLGIVKSLFCVLVGCMILPLVNYHLYEAQTGHDNRKLIQEVHSVMLIALFLLAVLK